jgi:excisionase family DNA binding protein
MSEPLYMRTRPFAELLGVTQETVRAHCKAGRIPGARQFGAAWLIPMDYVKSYIPADKQPPKSKAEPLEIVDDSEPDVFAEIRKRLKAK